MEKTKEVWVESRSLRDRNQTPPPPQAPRPCHRSATNNRPVLLTKRLEQSMGRTTLHKHSCEENYSSLYTVKKVNRIYDVHYEICYLHFLLTYFAWTTCTHRLNYSLILWWTNLDVIFYISCIMLYDKCLMYKGLFVILVAWMILVQLG